MSEDEAYRGRVILLTMIALMAACVILLGGIVSMYVSSFYHPMWPFS